MKSTIVSVVWVLLFLIFGFYIDHRVENFGQDYIQYVEATYRVVYEEDWDKSDKMLEDLFDKIKTQRDLWLKVLNHQYYDDIQLELNLIKNAIYCKNKIRALEGLERIKSILLNIIDDEKCNFNYIF